MSSKKSGYLHEYSPEDIQEFADDADREKNGDNSEFGLKKKDDE